MVARGPWFNEAPAENVCRWSRNGSDQGRLEDENKTLKGSVFALRAKRSKASSILPPAFPSRFLMVADTVVKGLLTLAPPSVTEPKLTFLAITEG
jgi:hypothetical protein